MFKNAYEGVRKIYTAQIMALIATVLMLIGTVLGLTGMKTGEATSAGEGLLVGGGALVLIAAILMIVGAIMDILGVNRASKDEDAFKNALIALCVGILANILISAFSSNPIVSSIGKAAATVTEMLASFFICTGIMNLAGRLGDGATQARGQSVRTLLLCIWAVAAVLNFLAALFVNDGTMQTILGVIAIAASLVSIVAYFLYLGLLRRARAMLEK